MNKKQDEEAARRVLETQTSRERDGQSALAEHRQAQEAISKRTAELRALRLEREAKQVPVKKGKAAKAAKPVSKVSLSDWYEEQKKSGWDT